MTSSQVSLTDCLIESLSQKLGETPHKNTLVEITIYTIGPGDQLPVQSLPLSRASGLLKFQGLLKLNNSQLNIVDTVDTCIMYYMN